MSVEDDLEALIGGINDFSAWTHADKIRLFAWVQHALRKKDRFSTGDINWCYETLHYNKTNVSQYLSDMEERKELLRDGRGLYLEGSVRAQYDAKYGQHHITLNIRRMVGACPRFS